MNSFQLETLSNANAVYKALLIQAKPLLLSLLNCWLIAYVPPERHIGTMHSMHFTPLSWQINSAVSIHSCTDRSESLPSKSLISLGSKFNDIAEIACKQNEDMSSSVQHWCHISRWNKTKICFSLPVSFICLLLLHCCRCWLAHSSFANCQDCTALAQVVASCFISFPSRIFAWEMHQITHMF